MSHFPGLRLGLCVLLALAAAAVLPGGAAAATLTVCPAGPPACQYATVAGAVAASADGDVIVIAPGSYAGGFTITTDVTLVGSGAGSTEIAGGAIGVTVATGADVVFRRLAVTDATETGVVNNGTLVIRRSTISGNGGFGVVEAGGIANYAALTLQDVTVADNTGRGAGGLDNLGSAVITGSTFDSNDAAFSAGAIRNDGGDVVFREGTITNNGSQGAGTWNHGSMTIVDSLVTGNSGGNNFGNFANDGSLVVRRTTVTGGFSFRGGGIATLETGVTSISDSLVWGNGARDGGGLYSTGSLTVTNTDVVSNSAAGGSGGGGIELVGGSLVVRFSSITGNTAANGHGGGVLIREGVATIANTTVSSNTAPDGGGIANRALGTLTLRFDTITFNTANIGGGVLNEGTLTRVGNIIANNVGGDCVGC